MTKLTILVLALLVVSLTFVSARRGRRRGYRRIRIHWSICRGSHWNRCQGRQSRYVRVCHGLWHRRCRHKVQSRPCNVIGCGKVNGKWSVWGAWGSCSVTCGGGRRIRSRTCTNPAPSGGGRDCAGSISQTGPCETNQCPPGCPPAGETRIRQEFTSMNTADRERYVRTIKTASTDSRYKPDYDTLITMHRTLFTLPGGIHTRNHFLTWHRWFILQYENLLRRVDCRFTVAYWDWSIVSANPWGTTANDLWFDGNSGFGGNGVGPNNCVPNGPFAYNNGRGWQLVPSAPSRCLSRRFTGNPPGAVDVARVLDIPPSQFTTFELAVRNNLHDTVHCLIAGGRGITMCTLDSASAPEFFLHHGFIDKLWEDWQKKSNTHRNAFFPGVTQPLPSTNLRGSLFVDNNALPGGVRVEYAPAGNRAVRNVVQRLRSLPPKKLEAIPRKRVTLECEPANKLFHVTKKERKGMKKIEKMLEPPALYVRSDDPPSSSSAMAKNLGFNPEVLKNVGQLHM